MGTNWDSGLLRWKDHSPNADERYFLSHLHPFVQRVELGATDKHPARSVQLYVSFGLHTFTRAIAAHDGENEIYRDNREVRTFCPERYQRSFELPNIFRTLEKRRCEFARGMRGLVNYVTMETIDGARVRRFPNLSNDLAWRTKKYLPRAMLSGLLRSAGRYDALHVTDTRTYVAASAQVASSARKRPLVVSAFGSLFAMLDRNKDATLQPSEWRNRLAESVAKAADRTPHPTPDALPTPSRDNLLDYYRRRGYVSLESRSLLICRTEITSP